MVIMGFDFKSLNDKIANSSPSPSLSQTKNVGVRIGDPIAPFLRAFRERERALLSRIPGDPTVGRLRDKKEKCSTRRGLRVGTGFREFLQTP